MAANPVCASHFECFAEIGACQRMPSGPAVLSDRTKRPDTRPQNRSSHHSNKSLAKQGPSTQGAESQRLLCLSCIDIANGGIGRANARPIHPSNRAPSADLALCGAALLRETSS